MSGKQERRHPRQTPKRPVGLQLEVVSGDGKVLAVPATLIDFSDYGCGLQTPSALNVGEVVTVKNLGFPGNLVRVSDKKARVAYCRHFDEGVFRSGLAFEDQPNSKQPPANGYPEAADSSLPDYYEVLQVSAQADLDTIQRIYRMLAQRYHPDNTDTGNDARFRLVLQAYRTLSDPESRAAYDVKHKAAVALRWKIFDKSDETGGFEDETKKRWAVLSALYMKRKREPEKPGVRLRDLEVLLGCPSEHLTFSLWYLRGKGQIISGDNGNQAITPEGADALEAAGPDVLPKMPKLLEQAGATSESGSTRPGPVDWSLSGARKAG